MSGVRVLVVDDSPDFHAAAAAVLVLDDRVTLVGGVQSAAQAVEFLRRHPVDLVLLDVHMPGQGGIEAVPRIVAARPSVVVVLCSTMPRDEALAAGADQVEYVEKSELSASRLWQSWEARHR